MNGRPSTGPASAADPATKGGRRRGDAAKLSFGRPCPNCTRPMHRMPRQFLDLLIALFVPVSRYRCPSIPCGWEGLLRERRQGPTSRDPMGPYPGDYSPKGASLPDAAPGDRPAKPLRQSLRHYR